MPVGAQIFVAKAFRDLKILFHARDHEQLFVLLRRLREGVKFSRRDSAWNQKVTRAFRRALGKNGRFDLNVPLAVEIVARRLRHAMTHPQITCETWPAKIEIPVRHSQIFILRFGVDRERQRVRPIQNAQSAWNDFNVAGGEVWIFRARQPRRDVTRNLDHIFATQGMRLLRKRRVFLRTKNNLRQPFAVAQINEDHSAMIARDIHPARESDLLADVAFAK